MAKNSKDKANKLVLEVKKQTPLILLILGVLVILFAGYLFFNLSKSGYINVPNAEVTEKEEPFYRHPLWGAWMYEKEDLPEVYAVMVENSADAWPLSGIEDAFLVIEAPVEGFIPRMVTFFSSDQEVEKIGPIRSARPYYIDWASSFVGLYVHVGGSPAALEQLNSASVMNFDQFFNGNYFWRSEDRRAPHNVYTSVKLLKEGRENRFAIKEPPIYKLWNFKDDALPENRPDKVDDLVINFNGSSLYKVTWKYDRESNSYLRYENSDPVTSSDGDDIFANNLAVIEVKMSVIDEVGRLSMETISKGPALFVQDGLISRVTWKKETPDSRIRFYREDGSEVEFNAGRTWIEVVKDLEKAIL